MIWECCLLERLDADRLLSDVVRPLLARPDGAGLDRALLVIRECRLVQRLDAEWIRKLMLGPLRRLRTKAARFAVTEIEGGVASR